jgi:hypothetical protein
VKPVSPTPVEFVFLMVLLPARRERRPVSPITPGVSAKEFFSVVATSVVKMRNVFSIALPLPVKKVRENVPLRMVFLPVPFRSVSKIPKAAWNGVLTNNVVQKMSAAKVNALPILVLLLNVWRKTQNAMATTG